MQTKPYIELRSIKHVAAMSEETHCYTATLYVDGIRWGTLSNRGYGAGDDFHGIDGRTRFNIQELDQRIAATFPLIEAHGFMVEQSLEMICVGLVNDFLAERDFKKVITKKIVFTRPDSPGIWAANPRKGSTVEADLVHFRAKYPTACFLNDLPVAEGLAIYRAN